jgi:selenide,water dikinase
VLSRLPRQTDPNVLVGFDTYDDAGVYQLNPEQALVQTVDILTPIADDPVQFGQIAAANSLSDVYAMGGRPLSALSIVCYPASDSPELLEAILRGGLEKMQEAGCAVISGHSIRDEELKIGYAVTGLVHPALIWRNAGARPGDVLLLSKPLGTGVLATALKQEGVLEEHMEAAIASMARLNRDAADALHEIAAATGDGQGRPAQESRGAGAVHAVTDITGFGLLGHAREMAAAGGVTFEIDHGRVPLLAGALEAARRGYLAGGLKNNREFIGGCVGFAERVPEDFRNLFFDPQTSGGLLVSLAPEAVPAALAAMERRGVLAQAIGRVMEKTSPLLRVI